MILKQESVDLLAQVSVLLEMCFFFFLFFVFRNIGLSGKDSGSTKTEVPFLYDRTSLVPYRNPQWKQRGEWNRIRI